MKALVIYYSLEGNTRFVAGRIAAMIEGDLEELSTRKPISPSNPLRVVQGRLQAITNRLPEIRPLQRNPDDYELILLGAPVWVENIAPPMKSFLVKTNWENRILAVFCCHSGGKGQALRYFQNEVSDGTVIGATDFLTPLRRPPEEIDTRVSHWIRDLRLRVREIHPA